jgi:hypothetical protein
VKVLQLLGGDLCTPGDEFYVCMPDSLVGAKFSIKDPGSKQEPSFAHVHKRTAL